VVHIGRDQHLPAHTATQRDTTVVVVHDAIGVFSEVHLPTAMNHAFAYKCALAIDHYAQYSCYSSATDNRVWQVILVDYSINAAYLLQYVSATVAISGTDKVYRADREDVLAALSCNTSIL
jgi:hypothetical protein